jgi:hypothetical protein
MNRTFGLTVCSLTVAVIVASTTIAAQTPPVAPVGTWVQDDYGPVVIVRRQYAFKPDGTYELALTTRQRGSMNQTLAALEKGVYRVAANRLVVMPESGAPRARTWRVERDRDTGNIRLVMDLPDGLLDIYYLD